jgi:hypothetical protein
MANGSVQRRQVTPCIYTKIFKPPAATELCAIRSSQMSSNTQGRVARLEPRQLDHREGGSPSPQMQGVTASPLR